MFDLNQAITTWRRQMLDAGIKAPVPLEELELHLREDLEQKRKSGWGEQESFESAVRRIGPPDALVAEFGKLGRDRAMKYWRLIGISYSIFAGAISIYLISLCLLEPRISQAFDWTDRILAFAAIGVSLGSLFAWRQGRRFLPVIPSRRTRMVISIACCLLGAAWIPAYLVFMAPHLLQTWVNHFFVSFAWICALTPILGGVGYGLENAARRHGAAVKD